MVNEIQVARVDQMTQRLCNLILQILLQGNQLWIGLLDLLPNPGAIDDVTNAFTGPPNDDPGKSVQAFLPVGTAVDIVGCEEERMLGDEDVAYFLAG